MSRSPARRLLDFGWRTAFRIGFPLARAWWGIRRRPHRGALVAVQVGEALLFVHASYRREWNFPGGSIRRGETPEAAARRELIEEIGLAASPLHPAGTERGIWDRREDEVFFFTLRLETLPDLRLDHREIVGARLMRPEEWRQAAVTGPVAAWLGRR